LRLQAQRPKLNRGPFMGHADFAVDAYATPNARRVMFCLACVETLPIWGQESPESWRNAGGMAEALQRADGGILNPRPPEPHTWSGTLT